MGCGQEIMRRLWKGLTSSPTGTKWEEQQVRGIAEAQSTCFGEDKYGSEMTNARNIRRKSAP